MAKVDSGAKTSTLHAKQIEIFEKDAKEWVRFVVFPKRSSKKIKYQLEAPVIETKNIRSSNGKLSIRPVIETQLRIDGQAWPIQITLVDRSVMGYRMLLGRTAFDKKYLIDSSRSFLTKGHKDTPLVASRANRGFSGLLKKTKKDRLAWNIIQTVISAILILSLRFLAIWLLNRRRFHSPAAKRMFIVYTRTVAIFLLFLATVIIWSTEFRALSFYLMAISVAVVIGLKEVISNLHGGFLLTSSRPFKIGDRIDVKKIRGDVLDTNFLTTRVAEVGSNGQGNEPNGRVTTIPNNVFLDNPIVNESYMKGFSPHTFVYPIKANGDWKKISNLILEVINEVTITYTNEAKTFFSRKDESDFLRNLNTVPTLDYEFASAEKIDIVIRIVVPSDKRHMIEREIKLGILEKTLATT